MPGKIAHVSAPQIWSGSRFVRWARREAIHAATIIAKTMMMP